MKKIYLILFIPFFLACNQNNTEETKTEPCNLKSLSDTTYVIRYKDFTVSNVAQIEKDSEGTDWRHSTKDEYRFVMKEYGASGGITIYNDTTYSDSTMEMPYVNGKMSAKKIIKKDTSIRQKIIYDNTLLIYKNGELIKKYTDINYIGTRYVPATPSKCVLDWSKERQNVSWWLAGDHIRGRYKDPLLDWSRGEEKRPILEFAATKNCEYSTSCYVHFHLNNNTSIEGVFTVGQDCK